MAAVMATSSTNGIDSDPEEAATAATMMLDSPGIGSPADSPSTSPNSSGYPTEPLMDAIVKPSIGQSHLPRDAAGHTPDDCFKAPLGMDFHLPRGSPCSPLGLSLSVWCCSFWGS